MGCGKSIPVVHSQHPSSPQQASTLPTERASIPSERRPATSEQATEGVTRDESNGVLAEDEKQFAAAFKPSIDEKAITEILDSRAPASSILQPNANSDHIDTIWGCSALHAACSVRRVDVVQLLLSSKCNVDQCDPHGRTAVHIITERLLVQLERWERYLRSSSTALEPAPSPEDARFAYNDPKSCALEEILLMLRSAGADMSKPQANRISISLNGQSRKGETRQNARLAAKNGAVWSRKTGTTALRDLQRALERHACLWEACSGKGVRSLDEVVHLYQRWGLRDGIDWNMQDACGRRLIHVAAQWGDAYTVQRLLDLGCDANAVDDYGRHALHYACFGASFEVVLLLLSLQPPLALAVDHHQRSALHLWRFEKREGGEIELKALTELAKASNFDHDQFGRTAGHVCAAAGSADAFRILCQHLEGCTPMELERKCRAAPLMGDVDGRVSVPRRLKRRRQQVSAQTKDDPDSQDRDCGVKSRTILEVALVAANHAIVHCVCGDGWVFPSNANDTGIERDRQLAETMCKCAAEPGLVPQHALSSAVEALVGNGGSWPAGIASDLVTAVAAAGKLDVLLEGETLMSKAAGSGDVTALSLLLELKADVHPHGMAVDPLVAAALTRQTETVKLLLVSGAGVDGSTGRMPLWRGDVASSEQGRAEAVSTTVDDANAGGKLSGSGEEQETEKSQEPADVWKRIKARQERQLQRERVRLHGRRVPTVDGDEVSCLVLSVISDQVEVAELLLQHGADCHAGAKLLTGETVSALHVLLRSKGAVLSLGANAERWRAAAAKMVQLGVPDDETVLGESTLTLAITHGYTEAAVELIARSSDKELRVPLAMAIRHGQGEVIQKMIERHVDLSNVGSSGESALLYAVQIQRYDIAALLCNHAWSLAGAESAMTVIVGELGRMAVAETELVFLAWKHRHRLNEQDHWFRSRTGHPCVYCWRTRRSALLRLNEERLVLPPLNCGARDDEAGPDPQRQSSAQRKESRTTWKEAVIASRAEVQMGSVQLAELLDRCDALRQTLGWQRRKVAMDPDAKHKLQSLRSACKPVVGDIMRQCSLISSCGTAGLELDDCHLSSIAFALTAVDWVLQGKTVAEPTGATNTSALTFAAMVGNRTLLAEASQVESCRSVKFDSESDRNAEGTVLSHSAAFTCKCPTRIQSVSHVGLSVLNGDNGVISHMLSTSPDCSGAAIFDGERNVSALHLLLMHTPPVPKEFRTAQNEQTVNLALQMVQLGCRDDVGAAGDSTLSLATRKGFIEVATALLGHGGLVPRSMHLALQEAVRGRSSTLVRAFLDQGASVRDVKVGSGRQSGLSVFELVRRSRDPEVADAVFGGFETWEGLMLLAACANSSKFMEKWSSMTIGDVSEVLQKTSEDGRTLLMHAIDGSSTDIVDALISGGMEGLWIVSEIRWAHTLARRHAIPGEPRVGADKLESSTPSREEKSADEGEGEDDDDDDDDSDDESLQRRSDAWSWDYDGRPRETTVADFSYTKRMHPVLLAIDLGKQDVALKLLGEYKEDLRFEFSWLGDRSLLELAAGRGMERVVRHLLSFNPDGQVLTPAVIQSATLVFNVDCITSMIEASRSVPIAPPSIQGRELDPLQIWCYRNVFSDALYFEECSKFVPEPQKEKVSHSHWQRKRHNHVGFWNHEEGSIRLDGEILRRCESALGSDESSKRWSWAITSNHGDALRVFVEHGQPLPATMLAHFSLALKYSRDAQSKAIVVSIQKQGLVPPPSDGDETRLLPSSAAAALCFDTAAEMLKCFQVRESCRDDDEREVVDTVMRAMAANKRGIIDIFASGGQSLPAGIKDAFDRWVTTDSPIDNLRREQNTNWLKVAAACVNDADIDEIPDSFTYSGCHHRRNWQDTSGFSESAIDASNTPSGQPTGETDYRGAFTPSPDTWAKNAMTARPNVATWPVLNPLQLGEFATTGSRMEWAHRGLMPWTIPSLEKALSSAGAVSALDLTGNHLASAGVAAILKLPAFASLRCIALCNTNIRVADAQQLAACLPQQLQHLDLDHNMQVGDVGAESVAQALSNHSALQYLSLCNVGMAEQGAKALARTVPSCQQLLHVGIGQQHVGEAGLSALVDALVASVQRGMRLKTVRFRFCADDWSVRDFLCGDRLDVAECSADDVVFLKHTVMARPELQVLNFARCELGDSGVHQLCEGVLARPGRLREISLAGVGMSHALLHELGSAVVALSCLQKLDVRENILLQKQRNGDSTDGDRAAVGRNQIARFLGLVLGSNGAVALQQVDLREVGIDAQELGLIAKAIARGPPVSLVEILLNAALMQAEGQSELFSKADVRGAVRALAEALASPRFQSLERVGLVKAVLDVRWLRTAETLDFRQTTFSRHEMRFIPHFLNTNSRLRALDLRGQDTWRTNCCAHFCLNTSLETVKIALPRKGKAMMQFCNLLCSAEIDLKSVPSVEFALHVLANNTALQGLDLPTAQDMRDCERVAFRALHGKSSLTRLGTQVVSSETQTLDFQGFTAQRNESGSELAFISNSFRFVTGLTSLNLAKNELAKKPQDFLQELFRAFSAAHFTGLTHLDLSTNGWTNASLTPWLNNDSVTTSLTSLSLANSQLGQETSLSALQNIPHVCAALKKLEVNSCGLRSLEGLASLLADSIRLQTLDVSYNGISGETLSTLANLIRGRTALTELHMQQNGLKESEWAVLSPAIASCSSLEVLDMATASKSGGEAWMIAMITQLPVLKSLNQMLLHDPDPEKWVIATVWTNPEMLLLAARLLQLSPLTKFPDLSKLPKALTLRQCGLASLPDGIELLTHLTELDVTDNRLEKLPLVALCSVTSLTLLACTGNPRLFSPPPEISDQGAQATMEYVRQAVEVGQASTTVLLAAIGDGESGKTSMINAVTSDNDVSERIHEDARTVGIDIREWVPASETNLTFRIMDLAGQAVYSLSHQFFLVRRSIYVLVWRARETTQGMSTGSMHKLREMVLHWMDSLQLRVPGATMVLVVTHIDCVSTEAQLTLQTDYVKQVVQTKLAQLEKQSASNNVLSLRVLREGESFRINCLSGVGVSELRQNLISLTLSLPWYLERIPKAYLELQQLVTEVLAGGKTWLDWKAFEGLARQCGLDDRHIRIATVFLHEIGTLKFFADVPTVMRIATEWHPPMTYLTTLQDTVFISSHWIIDALKGLLRHDREALMAYLATENIPDKNKWLRRVHRLSSFGVMHDELVPYMWPAPENSHFWQWARSQDREGSLWERNVATTPSDYRRVIALLTGCDVIHRIGDDEHVVPALLSPEHQHKVDARAYSDIESAFGFTAAYESLPPGFFERIVVRCRRLATHMDFTPTSAVFYWKGFKAQVFLVRSSQDGEESGPAKVSVISSSRRQMQAIDDNIHHVERFFPGLRRTSTDLLPGMDGRADPIQVLFVVSGVSLQAMIAAREIAQLVQSVDASSQVEGGSGAALSVKLPEQELLWLFETVEMKRDVLAKEAWRRSRPCMRALAKGVEQGLKIVQETASLNTVLQEFGVSSASSSLVETMDYCRQSLAAISGIFGQDDSLQGKAFMQRVVRLRADLLSLHAPPFAKLSEPERKVFTAVREALMAAGAAWLACRQLPSVSKEVLEIQIAESSKSSKSKRQVTAKELEEADAIVGQVCSAFTVLHDKWKEHIARSETSIKAGAKQVKMPELRKAVDDKLSAWQKAVQNERTTRTRLEDATSNADDCKLQHKDAVQRVASLQAEVKATLQQMEAHCSPRNKLAQLFPVQPVPYAVDLCFDMAAILLRYPLPSFKVGTNDQGAEQLETFGFANQASGFHQKLSTSQDEFIKELQRFQPHRVTAEDAELLAPYLEERAKLSEGGKDDSDFMRPFSEWLRLILECQKLTTDPVLSTVSAALAEEQAADKEWNEEVSNVQERQKHLKLVGEALVKGQQKLEQHALELRQLRAEERILHQRIAFAATSPLAYAAELLSLDVRDAMNTLLKQHTGSSADTSLSKVLSRLRDRGPRSESWGTLFQTQTTQFFGSTTVSSGWQVSASTPWLQYVQLCGQLHQFCTGIASDTALQESASGGQVRQQLGHLIAWRIPERDATGTSVWDRGMRRRCSELRKVVDSFCKTQEGAEAKWELSCAVSGMCAMTVDDQDADQRLSEASILLSHAVELPTIVSGALDAVEQLRGVVDTNFLRAQKLSSWLSEVSEDSEKSAFQMQETLLAELLQRHSAWWMAEDASQHGMQQGDDDEMPPNSSDKDLASALAQSNSDEETRLLARLALYRRVPESLHTVLKSERMRMACEPDQNHLVIDLETLSLREISTRLMARLLTNNESGDVLLSAADFMLDQGLCACDRVLPASIAVMGQRLAAKSHADAQCGEEMAECNEQLQSLSTAEMRALGSLTDPPKLVCEVMNTVCIIMNRSQEWTKSKFLLLDQNLCKQLVDPASVGSFSQAKVEALKKALPPELQPDKVAEVSVVAGVICRWARARLALELAFQESMRANAETTGGDGGARLAKSSELYVVLRKHMPLDAEYLDRIDDMDACLAQTSRMHRLFRSAPLPERQELRAECKQARVWSFADLLAKRHDSAEGDQLVRNHPWLADSLAHLEAEPVNDSNDVRVVILCVDASLAEDLEAVASFKEHVAKRRPIIPIIMPGYSVVDYSKWWPDTLPELAGHALFVDVRKSDTWGSKVAQELLPQVTKFLVEWRGDTADTDALHVVAKVPCEECVSSGSREAFHFDREDVLQLLENWRLANLRAMSGPDQTSVDTIQGLSGDSEETLTVQCGVGHAMRVSDILSRAVIHDAVPCPQCTHSGETPPHCFNRRYCLLYFGEDNHGRVGALECDKCRAAGRPYSVRILDIIAPEVFLSYNWGVTQDDGKGGKEYSTQAIVKPLQQRLEQEEDIICWFDIGGGMGAGQDLKAEMEEGIRKCTVVVVFLSDSYVNSDNCKREYAHAVRMCKFLIPVLVPAGHGGSTRFGSSGWTGPGLEDDKWWAHALKMCVNNEHPDSKQPLAWSILQHFKPIDMRTDGQTASGSVAELEIRRRIASRFHRGEHIMHKTAATYARWTRTRAKVRHALANRRAGKHSALFSTTGAGT